MKDLFKNTLIISPHCDDETIGCGGLIHNIVQQGCDVRVIIVATHGDTNSNVVDNETRMLETENALDVLGVGDWKIHQLSGFRDGYLDQCSKKDLISALDKQIKEFKPTTVLFPYSSHHQDHQVVYQASIAALRPTVATNHIKLKAAYEYPYITTSWNSTMRSDSKIYYPLTAKDMQKKEEALKEYKSQLVRDPRDILDISSILNLARVRGTEIGEYYAEAFYPLSIVL